jgi:hypothetical protein
MFLWNTWIKIVVKVTDFVDEKCRKNVKVFFIDDSNVTPDLLNAADSKDVSHFESLKFHAQSGRSEYLGIFTRR